MKTKLTLLVLIAALAFTGCKKDDTTPPDAYADFKADATTRWENGTIVELNDASSNTFVIDAGGTLFSSSKYKNRPHHRR
jgi:outer membrane lipoprotein SlyB